MKKYVLIIIFILISSSGVCSSLKDLDKGLQFYNFQGAVAGYNYDIYILKINPDFYSLTLLMCSKTKQKPMTLKKWAEKYNLIAAINASMFWKDQRTSTGYMRSNKYINQKLIHKGYGGFFVFDPKDKDLPYVDIVERGKAIDSWKNLLERYNNVIQNFRMISKNGKNLWREKEKAFSVSAIGIDKKQNVLFIFSKFPVPMYYLNEILLKLPININGCLFTEGGSTSGLYIRYKDFEFESSGYSQIEVLPMSEQKQNIPNVLGIKKR